jgi:hypothetical protein
LYVNNAFGYPQEVSIAAKRLKCIYQSGDRERCP